MKRIFQIVFIILIPSFGMAQTSVLGKWKTVDDNSGKETSIIEIFERDGKIHGKIIQTFPEPNEPKDPICEKCDKADARYKKKIIGMEILKDLEKDGDEYADGTILDPKNGKVYDCKIWMEAGNLKVRGYLGPFFRTQTWKKVH